MTPANEIFVTFRNVLTLQASQRRACGQQSHRLTGDHHQNTAASVFIELPRAAWKTVLCPALSLAQTKPRRYEQAVHFVTQFVPGTSRMPRWVRSWEETHIPASVDGMLDDRDIDCTPTADRSRWTMDAYGMAPGRAVQPPGGDRAQGKAVPRSV